ncbi:hypothetical protein B0T24DRAFT_77086 [Lasiosphaeria ovina]|uniref:Secreted protein n=1 Tax=Lasiosphaeria ovina TaxID=92902 RepID=A0AAE0TYI6_9PEZI|nr:hypothetical protein B0T24DRAFT_77086 [Lasiosphaeria ovina]
MTRKGSTPGAICVLLGLIKLVTCTAVSKCQSNLNLTSLLPNVEQSTQHSQTWTPSTTRSHVTPAVHAPLWMNARLRHIAPRCTLPGLTWSARRLNTTSVSGPGRRCLDSQRGLWMTRIGSTILPCLTWPRRGSRDEW